MLEELNLKPLFLDQNVCLGTSNVILQMIKLYFVND